MDRPRRLLGPLIGFLVCAVSGQRALETRQIAQASPAPSPPLLRLDRGWPVLEWKGRPLTRALDHPSVTVTVEGQDLPAALPRLADISPDSAVYRTEVGTLTDLFEPFPRFPNCFRRRWCRRRTGRALRARTRPSRRTGPATGVL